MKQKIVPVALVSVTLGLLFDILFFGKPPGISVLLSASMFKGAYALLYMRPAASKKDSEPKLFFALGSTETFTILGSVGLLFFLFLLVQVTYFFGGNDQVLGTDFTYAEYARKGFFELTAVAVITMILILAVRKSTELATPGQIKLFKC